MLTLPETLTLGPSPALWELWLCFGFPHTGGLICRDISPKMEGEILRLRRRSGQSVLCSQGLPDSPTPDTDEGTQAQHGVGVALASIPELLPGSPGLGTRAGHQAAPSLQEGRCSGGGELRRASWGTGTTAGVPSSSQAQGQASFSRGLLSLLWKRSRTVWHWGTGGRRGEPKTGEGGAGRGARPVPWTCAPAIRADSWAPPCSRVWREAVGRTNP